jgi:hypothetical protein
MSDEFEWVRGERHVPHEGGASRRSTSCTRSALKRERNGARQVDAHEVKRAVGVRRGASTR